MLGGDRTGILKSLEYGEKVETASTTSDKLRYVDSLLCSKVGLNVNSIKAISSVSKDLIFLRSLLLGMWSVIYSCADAPSRCRVEFAGMRSGSTKSRTRFGSEIFLLCFFLLAFDLDNLGTKSSSN